MPTTFTPGTVTSSMDALLDLAEKGELNTWDNVLAAMQTAGRGQGRKHWVCLEGNIFGAILLPQQTPFTEIGAAVALSALIWKSLSASGYPVYIKWPNDVVIRHNDKYLKVVGSLLEDKKGFLIAGIGINLHLAPAENLLPEQGQLAPGCLAQTGAPVAKAPQLWSRLVDAMVNFYTASDFAETWTQLANEALIWKNQKIGWTDGKHEVFGKLEGIASNGGVILTVAGQNEIKTSGNLFLPQ